MSVTPSKRRRGLSRELMQAILERAAKIQGLDHIVLSVTETQTPARKLYYSLGFETFGREPRALKIGDHVIDEDYMILRIAQPS